MSGGGSKEQEKELLSIETYSGNVIGEINKDATNIEIQQFIQEKTKNKSHVRLMRTEDAIMFGFIDNFGLWFGMDALDPIIPGGILTKAGIGNSFSNTLGAILATFSTEIMSYLIKSKTDDDITNTPIWSNALGTGAGCLFAIFICRLITQRK